MRFDWSAVFESFWYKNNYCAWYKFLERLPLRE